MLLPPGIGVSENKRDALRGEEYVSPFEKGADIADGEDLTVRYSCRETCDLRKEMGTKSVQ